MEKHFISETRTSKYGSYRNTIAKMTILFACLSTVYLFSVVLTPQLSYVRRGYQLQQKSGDGEMKTLYITSDCNGRLGNQISSASTIYAYARIVQEIFRSIHELFPNEQTESINVVPLVNEQQQDLLRPMFTNVLELGSETSTFLPYLGVSYNRDDIIKMRTFMRNTNDTNLKQEVVDIIRKLSTEMNGFKSVMKIDHYPNDIASFYPYLNEMRENGYLKVQEDVEEESRRRIQIVSRTWRRFQASHRGRNGIKHDLIFIGIHVRLDDYGSHLKGLYGAQYVNSDYYNKSVAYFKAIHRNPVFVLISQTQNVTGLSSHTGFTIIDESMSYESMKKIHSHNGHAVVLAPSLNLDEKTTHGYDLSLLSACNHSILTYGTYGLWGGALLNLDQKQLNLPSAKTILTPTGFNMTIEMQQLHEALDNGYMRQQWRWI